MPGNVAFADLVTRLYTLDTCRELWSACTDYIQAQGFRRYSYHHYHSNERRGRGPATFSLSAEGFPEAWVHAYLEQDLHAIDPIPRLALASRQPLFWSDVAAGAAPGSDAARFCAAAGAAGLGDGLAIAVDGMGFQPGYVGLGFGPERPYISAAGLNEVRSAAQLAHLAHLRVLESRLSRRFDLSPRERQVLGHVVGGLSNAAIAAALDVSRHTVDTLMRRLFDKLEVADRTSAAIRGLEAGLVRANQSVDIARAA